MNSSNPSQFRRAIVIGASIAGSLVAKTLASRFEEVVILDRDRLPEGPTPRSTVPQEHHVHLLLQRGREIMESFYPGFLTNIEEGGAEIVDLSHGVMWHLAGRWKHRWPTGFTAHYCSRTLIEHTLRKRAAELPNVSIRQNTTVSEIVHDDESKRVTGVSLIGSDGVTEELSADLVIDASGRGTRSPAWVKELGYGVVKEEQVISRLGYVSRIYKRGASDARNWTVLLCTPKLPDQRKMAVISPIEGDRFMVTTGGWLGAFPELNEESFLEHLKSLSVPDLHDAVRKLEPISEFKRFRLPGSLRRHYEKMSNWPGNYLVVGDALCSINPIYSQGMSVSAMQIETLEACIDSYLADKIEAKTLFERLFAVTERSWQQAKDGDERLPELGIRPKWSGKLLNIYFDALIAASAHSRTITIALLKSNNLVAGEHTVFHPRVLISVATESLARLFNLRAR
ncbi:FAD-dependent monooxygenase [Rhizobium sp. CFBP 8762]|uniref:FAD-dependent oxidoreductase n=1 Tax=Rhizobium sp. CFBP 8762 TaxID=2775279 RepID=UPI001781096E|nr:FAD-dependent monooxygenase [Rhizobium sp. CFBP 8762]MBD8555177.1 FAD-dependent monooxygenase [Rhizobium sp. CFBP 8762]